MNDIDDEAVREAIAHASVDRVMVRTVELHHSTFSEPARLVVSHGEILSEEPLIFGHRFRLEANAPADAGELVTFIAAQIELPMPGQQENRLPELVFAIDAVSGRIAKLPRLATGLFKRDKVSKHFFFAYALAHFPLIYREFSYRGFLFHAQEDQ